MNLKPPASACLSVAALPPPGLPSSPLSIHEHPRHTHYSLTPSSLPPLPQKVAIPCHHHHHHHHYHNSLSTTTTTTTIYYYHYYYYYYYYFHNNINNNTAAATTSTIPCITSFPGQFNTSSPF
ncbi:hypothetical protein E2C01_048127 [Portunus trituberculatus]|uniref:Uncharacterized protein n=1 Tax=Portunus trituberculatus TaxID=210409 RepID=A0A5B7G9C8_PORTR|nr:hypothetical protein [Portunus trituberculatus]